MWPEPTDSQHGDQVRQETERLRRQAADLPDMIAQTEEKVADTLERIAKTGPPADALRLRAQADRARRYGASERDRAAKYSEPPA